MRVVVYYSVATHNCLSFPSIGTRPNLIELIHFRGRERTINIPLEVGTHYQQLGILLLNDQWGSRVDSIVHKHQHRGPECINVAILQEWIEGKGMPLTWEALVETLEKIQLNVLAKDIRDALKTATQ